MRESWRSWLWRQLFNLLPAYHGTGGRIAYIAADWSEVRVRLPLSWRTRNYVGTIFGGSIYGAVDPIYMMMLIRRLGRGYIVWDKVATIAFRKPGRTTLHARFTLDETELAAIAAALQEQRSITRTYQVDLTDAAGVVHASIEKLIYIRRTDAVSDMHDAPAGAERTR